MNRLKKIGTIIATVGLLAGFFVPTAVSAQVASNAPIEVAVDIMLKVKSEAQAKRQENATYEIVNEAGEIVYDHISDAQTSGTNTLPAGKYRLRIYDGQQFVREGKPIVTNKVEMSIPKRNEQEVAANKQLRELLNKGEVHTDQDGDKYYEIPFTVEAGPDLEDASHTKMTTKLVVNLGEEGDLPTDSSADGQASQSSQSASTQNQPENAATGSVRFTVVDQNQQPVADAKVQFNQETKASDASGTVNFDNLPAGNYTYSVAGLPSGYEGELNTTLALEAGATKQVNIQVMKLPTERFVVIQVVDQDGKAVPGAELKVGEMTLITDEAGRAQFNGITTDTVSYSVTKLPEGYQGNPSGQANASSDVSQVTTLTVEKAAPKQRQLLVRVKDNQGTAVEGAQVQVGDTTLVTDAQGQAQFENVTSDYVHYQITQLPAGYQGDVSGDVDVPTDLNRALDLTVEKVESERQAVFKVVDQEGNGVEGATVQVEELTQATDVEGQVRFEGIKKATVHYRLVSLPANYQGNAEGEAELPTDTEQLVTLTVTKETPKRSLSVKVVDQEGNGVPNVTVQVGSATKTTDSDGVVTFEGLTSDKVTYQVSGLPAGYQGQTSGEIEVPQVQNEPVTLSVNKPTPTERHVTMKVLDQDGYGVEGAMVQVGESIQPTDAEGKTRFDGILTEKVHYKLIQLPSGYQGNAEGEAEVPTDTEHSITLTVEKLPASASSSSEAQTQSLTVTVLDQEGKPVAGVGVKVGETTLTTDDAGHVVFEQVPIGEVQYEIVSLPDGYTGQTTANTTITSQANQTLNVTVTKSVAKATVTIQVVDDQQKGVDGVGVYLGDKQATTVNGGVASFTDVEPSNYSYGISTLPEGYTSQTTEQVLNVPAGANLTQMLTVTPKAVTAQLELSVVNVNGQAVADVGLKLGERTARTDANGVATFKDLTPGDYEYQLTSVPDNYQLNEAKLKINLVAGQTQKRTIQLLEKTVTPTASSSSEEAVVATKTTNVERKGGLPSTGELLSSWVVPLAAVFIGIGAVLLFRKRKEDSQTNKK